MVSAAFSCSLSCLSEGKHRQRKKHILVFCKYVLGEAWTFRVFSHLVPLSPQSGLRLITLHLLRICEENSDPSEVNHTQSAPGLLHPL